MTISRFGRLILYALAASVVILYLARNSEPAAPGIGETTTVHTANGYWPCGSTTEALDEMEKWRALGDSQEVARVLLRTGSGRLVGGMKVKILDTGFEKRKVRALTNANGKALPGDLECWVTSDAVR
jgi:hypothetical protein